MIVVAGLKQYGRIASDVPRDYGYRATIFFHVLFLPLLPIAGVAMRGGDDGFGVFAAGTGGGTVTPLGNLLTLARAGGRPAPLFWRSVLAGYLRLWCGLIALALCSFAILVVLEWLGQIASGTTGNGFIRSSAFLRLAGIGVGALAIWWWAMFRLGRSPSKCSKQKGA